MWGRKVKIYCSEMCCQQLCRGFDLERNEKCFFVGNLWWFEFNFHLSGQLGNLGWPSISFLRKKYTSIRGCVQGKYLYRQLIKLFCYFTIAYSNEDLHVRFRLKTCYRTRLAAIWNFKLRKLINLIKLCNMDFKLIRIKKYK